MTVLMTVRGHCVPYRRGTLFPTPGTDSLPFGTRSLGNSVPHQRLGEAAPAELRSCARGVRARENSGCRSVAYSANARRTTRWASVRPLRLQAESRARQLMACLLVAVGESPLRLAAQTLRFGSPGCLRSSACRVWPVGPRRREPVRFKAMSRRPGGDAPVGRCCRSPGVCRWHGP